MEITIDKKVKVSLPKIPKPSDKPKPVSIPMEYKKRVFCHHCSADQWILREMDVFTCKLCGNKVAILTDDDYKILLDLCILHGGESLISKLRLIIGEDYGEEDKDKVTQ